MTRSVKVFASMRTVSRKADPSHPRYAIELVARGNGTVMYRSAPCENEGEAVRLAKQYLRRHPDLVDTTAISGDGHGWRIMWGVVSPAPQAAVDEAPERASKSFIEQILDSAEAHGSESDPDHEVGDLRQALEIAWKHMTGPQRREAWAEFFTMSEHWDERTG